MELYKKYRPQRLKSMIGNDGTIRSLEKYLEDGDLPHSILFSGPSGCGKTTLGRILKDELGCSEIDFKELNCSNDTGIDFIRGITRIMTMAPTGGKVRIFLLDEVHRLSLQAQDASLKILEDTPDHVYFFLCTTDPQKLKDTIRNRCCPMPVAPLKDKEMEKLIHRILNKESGEVEEDVIQDIIDAAGGSSRKALVILERILKLPEDDRKIAVNLDLEDEQVINLCRALLKADPWDKVAKILKGIKAEPESVRWAVLGYAKSVLLNKKNHQAALIIDSFRDHFYDSKEAGLVLACYEICGK